MYYFETVTMETLQNLSYLKITSLRINEHCLV